MGEVESNLAEVRARIGRAAERAGRDPKAVRLVVVSKRQPEERVAAAYAAGQRDFAENYVQEFERRRTLLPADVRWHLIGHLQTNKARAAAGAALVHTVDSERLAIALARATEAAGTRLEILLEINVSLESQKAGVAPTEAERLLEAVRPLTSLNVAGLMCIPAPGEGRKGFELLRSLRDTLAARSGLPLPELSMGMSDDFEVAVEAGATLVRVGTAILGNRANTQT